MKKQAFTLIELLISIVIIGILSMLLFRTMAEMIRGNARIQEEKILAKELISIQTSINNLAEHYPFIDRETYNAGEILSNTSKLHLTNLSGEKLTIYGTGDCETSQCGLVAEVNGETIELTNFLKTKLSDISFKVFPLKVFQINQYQDLTKKEISQPGFWIFGHLRNNLAPGFEHKTSHTLQHFVNLKYKNNR